MYQIPDQVTLRRLTNKDIYEMVEAIGMLLICSGVGTVAYIISADWAVTTRSVAITSMVFATLIFLFVVRHFVRAAFLEKSTPTPESAPSASTQWR